MGVRMRNGLFSVHFTVSLDGAGIEAWMTKVETNRGACGFSVMMALITEFYNKVKIDIKTDWEQVKELAKEIDYLAIQDILGIPSVGTEFV